MAEPNTRPRRPDRRSIHDMKTVNAARASAAASLVLAMLLILIVGSNKSAIDNAVGLIRPKAVETAGKATVIKPTPLFVSSEDPF